MVQKRFLQFFAEQSYKTNCTHLIFRTIKARTSLPQQIIKMTEQHKTFSKRIDY